jgi:hypothetical protein
MPEPASQPLEYEPSHVSARLKRRRWERRLVILGVLAFAGLLVWGYADEIRGRWDSWARGRALQRSMDRPPAERFMPGEVVYAVPDDFYSPGIPVGDPALFGTISAESIAAGAELTAATGWTSGPEPILFLGKLIDAEGTEVLFGVGFLRTYVWSDDTTWPHSGETTKAGFYTDLQYLYVTRNRGSGGTGEHRHLGPLSLLEWDHKSQDSHVAALPLAFYGSYVDANDASVAVIPFRLGDHTGRIRISIRDNFAHPESFVEWD